MISCPLLARSAGLVLSTTKGVGPIQIDRIGIRARRLRKSLLTGARLLQDQTRQEWGRCHAFFVTLTYAENQAWAPNQINAFMRRLGWWCKSKGIERRAEWCLEFTRRGRPHYHVIVWLPKRLQLPKPDKCGWWVQGHSNRELARSPVGYLAKYASKFTPEAVAAFPKGARSHGVSGLEKEGARELRWWKSPLFSREVLGDGADIRKAPGGYLDRVTGVYARSPWRVEIDAGGRIFVHKIEEYTNGKSYH